ncbi:MAG: ATP-binding cassette domain-containing protein [Bacteroidales bacterium]|nr:ATP-binding cassette domain-containing protein [Bacteroidales bacterium]
MEDNRLIRYEHVDICLDDYIVLKDVTFEVEKGEFVYLIGKVGSGKSTLLKTLYAEVPLRRKDLSAEAEAGIFDYDLIGLKPRKALSLRRELGIVFQDFKLLTDRTIEDNLKFVLRATGWKDKSEIAQRIEEVLTQVGMQNKGYKMPHELSGGEQQRMVIARALLNHPRVILADEPTGNLDVETSQAIVQLLHDIRQSGTTVIMTTHNLSFLESFPGRVMKCENGKLTCNETN